MGKGSGKRKQDVTDEELEENWNRIFKGNVARKEEEDGNIANVRTLKKLRDSGDYPLVAIVERWNNFAKVRQDLFGIIDLLAVDTKGNTVGIQVTSYSNISARVKKMEDSDAIHHLRNANWVLLVQGWHKKNNKWVCREVDIS